MLCRTVCIRVQGSTLNFNANCSPVDVVGLSILAMDGLFVCMTCKDLQASQQEDCCRSGQYDQVLSQVLICLLLIGHCLFFRSRCELRHVPKEHVKQKGVLQPHCS